MTDQAKRRRAPKEPAMIWTHDKPTVLGWYWWRYTDERASIVFFDGWQMVQHVDRDNTHIDYMRGEWAGPLEPPEER